MKLIDTESGNIDSLKKELGVAEGLLRDGAFVNAAVALFAIVKSPRYTAFLDFCVEFQNAEYDLAVALARASSYGSALDTIEQILKRGPAAPGIGARRIAAAVDIALGDPRSRQASSRASRSRSSSPIRFRRRPPASARICLRGRAPLYDAGKLTDCRGRARPDLEEVAAVFVGGVSARRHSRAARRVQGIRRGDVRDRGDASTTTKFTFVVDDRYFTVKDLCAPRARAPARARGFGEYDDAYYHLLPDPRRLGVLARRAVRGVVVDVPEARAPDVARLGRRVLERVPDLPAVAGGELCSRATSSSPDCKFTDSQQWYDALVTRLQPIVDEIDKVRKDPELRRQLFAKAVTRFHEVKDTGEIAGKKAGTAKAGTPIDEVLGLLRLDPKFTRLNDALTGMTELANGAPGVVRTWQSLAQQVSEKKVAAVSTAKTVEQEQLADANALVEDFRRLGTQLLAARAEMARGKREGTLPADIADQEMKRLDDLFERVQLAQVNAIGLADKSAASVTASTTPRPAFARRSKSTSPTRAASTRSRTSSRSS